MNKIHHYISNLLFQSHGIDISKYNASFLDNSIRKRIIEVNSESPEEYYILITQSIQERESFLHSLQISYSAFFRNPLTFSVLEQIVFPALIAKKATSGHSEIRVWSAACASGHEAYSLAMVMEGVNEIRNIKTNYRIFATDQVEMQIQQALEGKYPANSLSNISLRRVKQWFIKHGDTYAVKPELKLNIDFSEFDLFNEQYSSPPASIFGDFDLVMCANLLFYYKPEYQKKIIEKTTRCLSDGGFLVVGETERDILNHHNFREVFPQSGIFQKSKHK